MFDLLLMFLVYRSPAAMNIVMRQGWMALGVSIAAMIGSGMLVRSIPYQELLMLLLYF